MGRFITKSFQFNRVYPYHVMRKGSTGLFDFNYFLRSVPTRLDPNLPILVNDGVYENTCPAGVATDPLDPTKFLFYRGEFFGSISVGARISLFIGDKTDPFSLGTTQGVVLAGTPGTYDENGCRFGTPVVANGIIHYFYVGIDALFKWRICLATLTDGRIPIKYGVVLDFNGIDELSVSDPSIIYEDGWYWMVYTVWDGATAPANNNPGRSRVGMKLAKSQDLFNWTKTETVVIPRGTGGEFDDTNIEGGQLLNYNGNKVILYNANDGTIWSIGMAYSRNVNAAFRKVTTNPWFSASVSGWDDFLVACPLICNFSNKQVMYYQALSQSDPLAIDIGAINLVIT